MKLSLSELLASLVASSLIVACGSAPPVIPDDTMVDFIPVAVGNRWTYDITTAGGVKSIKVQTVTGTATADGEMAYTFLTTRNDDKGTRSTQLVRDGRLVRAAEDTLESNVVKETYRFEPFGLRVDSTVLTVGATYTDRHSKQKLASDGSVSEVDEKVHVFTVEAVDELVTVPAGEFECVRIRRERDDGSVKTYWYAPGVGKVREGGMQTEELIRVEMASSPSGATN